MSLKSGKKYLQEVHSHCQSTSFCSVCSWGRLPNLSLWTFTLLLFWAYYMKLVLNFSYLCFWQRCWEILFPFTIFVCTWYIVGSPFGSLDEWRKWSCCSVNRGEKEVCTNFTDHHWSWVQPRCPVTPRLLQSHRCLSHCRGQTQKYLVDFHVPFLENWNIDIHRFHSSLELALFSEACRRSHFLPGR